MSNLNYSGRGFTLSGPESENAEGMVTDLDVYGPTPAATTTSTATNTNTGAAGTGVSLDNLTIAPAGTANALPATGPYTYEQQVQDSFNNLGETSAWHNKTLELGADQGIDASRVLAAAQSQTPNENFDYATFLTWLDRDTDYGVDGSTGKLIRKVQASTGTDGGNAGGETGGGTGTGTGGGDLDTPPPPLLGGQPAVQAFNSVASNATATKADFVKGEVDEEETSAFQLQKMLDSNSPYMTQARLAGERFAASRGMINSSIAGGNAQAEAIKAAQPFAVNDANTYAQQSIENQRGENDTNRTNATNETNVSVGNASNATSVANTNATNATSVSTTNAQINQDEINSRRDAETRRLTEAAANENRLAVQKLSNDTQIAIAEFEAEVTANNNNTIVKQTTIGNLINAIAGLEGNPDLNVTQKNAAVTSLLGYYKTAMDYNESLSTAG